MQFQDNKSTNVLFIDMFLSICKSCDAICLLCEVA